MVNSLTSNIIFSSNCRHLDYRYVDFTTRSELRKVLFLTPLVCGFLFVYEISREPLNGFVPNSQGRRVLSLARMSLKAKVNGQRSRSPWTNNGIFGHYGVLRVVLFSKTSLAFIFWFPPQRRHVAMVKVKFIAKYHLHQRRSGIYGTPKTNFYDNLG